MINDQPVPSFDKTLLTNSAGSQQSEEKRQAQLHCKEGVIKWLISDVLLIELEAARTSSFTSQQQQKQQQQQHQRISSSFSTSGISSSTNTVTSSSGIGTDNDAASFAAASVSSSSSSMLLLQSTQSSASINTLPSSNDRTALVSDPSGLM